MRRQVEIELVLFKRTPNASGAKLTTIVPNKVTNCHSTVGTVLRSAYTFLDSRSGGRIPLFFHAAATAAAAAAAAAMRRELDVAASAELLRQSGNPFASGRKE